MPALLTRMSMFFHSEASFAIRFTLSARVTSPGKARTSISYSASISSATSSSFSGPRAFSTREAPSLANAFAIAKPIPLLAPVISAVFPAKRLVIS